VTGLKSTLKSLVSSESSKGMRKIISGVKISLGRAAIPLMSTCIGHYSPPRSFMRSGLSGGVSRAVGVAGCSLCNSTEHSIESAAQAELGIAARHPGGHVMQ